MKGILKEKEKGITLIALVITIIVLLILAGVTIATLTGDNGILTQANNAKENTKQASEDELRKLTQVEATTYLEEHEYEDSNGKKVTIPAKCAVSQVEGENTLEDGLVIRDVNGNEWVWIQVPKSEMPDGLTFEDDTDYETLKIALKNYTSNYAARLDYIDEWFDVNGNNASESSNLQDRSGCGLTNEEYITLYNKMLKSVYQNLGFWVGRYEAGIAEPRVLPQEVTEKAKIQKEMYPYNYISCAEAQSLASQTSPDTLKTSSLLFGIQWDLVCKFFETKGNITLDDIKTNSQSWGNYSDSTFQVSSGKYAIHNKNTNKLTDWKKITQTYEKPYEGEENLVLFSTGVTDRNQKMNICDLAGNAGEYTLERSTTSGIPCVTRGGNFRSSGCVALRGSYNSNNKLSSSISFRIAMY